MATKNYKNMTTKKLEALIATASEEDKAAINEVLQARAQMAQGPAGQAEGGNEEEALTPAEQAAIEAAEANGGINPMFNGKQATDKAEKAPKMTLEELHKLNEEVRAKVLNHKCKAVPFNTVDWVDGVIVGTTEEKRSCKILLAIKLEDGRRIVKVHDSNLIQVSDEVVEPRVNSPHRTIKDSTKAAKEPWTEDKLIELLGLYKGNIGRAVSIEKAVMTPEGEQVTVEEGRIVGLSVDKRCQAIMYRITVPTEAGNANRYKRVDAQGMAIKDADEISEALLQKHIARSERTAKGLKALTAEARVVRYEERKKALASKLADFQAKYDEVCAALKKAKAELGNQNNEAQAEAEAVVENNEPLA